MATATEKPNPADHIDEHILYRLDPEFVKFYTEHVLTSKTTIRTATIADLRRDPARFRPLSAIDASQGIDRVSDFTVTSEDGAEIPVRVYHPDPLEHGPGPYPLHLNFHGGGYVHGDLYCEAQLCLSMREAGVVVVDVNYRHCPETLWGKCFEDAWAALTWARASAATLNILPDSVSLGGVSAGAHIAIVLQFRARDEGVPLRLVMPTVPPAAGSLFHRYVTDSPYPSMLEMVHSPILAWERIQFYMNLCLSSTKDAEKEDNTVLVDDADRAACIARLRARWPACWLEPIRQTRWDGLADALIRTAELDNLRDEGEDYAAKLATGGGRVTLHRYRGAVHTFMFYDFMASKRAFDAESIAALRQAHGLAPLSDAVLAAKVGGVITLVQKKRAADEDAKRQSGDRKSVV